MGHLLAETQVFQNQVMCGIALAIGLMILLGVWFADATGVLEVRKLPRGRGPVVGYRYREDDPVEFRRRLIIGYTFAGLLILGSICGYACIRLTN